MRYEIRMEDTIKKIIRVSKKVFIQSNQKETTTNLSMMHWELINQETSNNLVTSSDTSTME